MKTILLLVSLVLVVGCTSVQEDEIDRAIAARIIARAAR